MTRKFFTAAGLTATLGAVIVALSASGAAARPAVKTTKIRCTSTTYNVSSAQHPGLILAALNCSTPLGAGVQKGASKTSIAGTTLSVTGAFTNFYNTGTIRGTYKLSGTLSGATITATGSVTVTGGTGAYTHLKGTGKLSCTTTDAGKTYDCSTSGTLTS